MGRREKGAQSDGGVVLFVGFHSFRKMTAGMLDNGTFEDRERADSGTEQQNLVVLTAGNGLGVPRTNKGSGGRQAAK